jgi:hypothetical protein
MRSVLIFHIHDVKISIAMRANYLFSWQPCVRKSFGSLLPLYATASWTTSGYLGLVGSLRLAASLPFLEPGFKTSDGNNSIAQLLMLGAFCSNACTMNDKIDPAKVETTFFKDSDLDKLIVEVNGLLSEYPDAYVLKNFNLIKMLDDSFVKKALMLKCIDFY